jgi:tRNA(fMet)-specific endonuclease VapC
MKHLVDTDWILHCLHGNQEATDTVSRLAADGLAVSIISVAEVYEGAYGAFDPRAEL